MRPYKYQEPAISQHVQNIKKFGSSLDCSDTGTGKTYIAAFVLKSLNKNCNLPATVICPKAVIPAWQEALKNLNLPICEIINYEKARVRGLQNPKFIIFDEVHRCGGRNTLNSKILANAKAKKVPHLMLSATAADSPLRMKSIGYSLDLFCLNKWWSWCLKNGVHKTWHGGHVFEKGKYLKKIHDQIGNRLVRIQKENLPDWPDCTIDFIKLPGQKIKYDDEYLEVRQKTELSKVKHIKELVEDLVSQGHSVPIFVNYKDTFCELVNILKKHLDKKVCNGIVGGQNASERDYLIQQFQKNKLKVLPVMVQAGGVGLSLHDKLGTSPRVALHCLPESAIHFIQALGRINRANQKGFAINRILITEGTFEEKIKNRIDKKIEFINLLQDGDLK